MHFCRCKYLRFLFSLILNNEEDQLRKSSVTIFWFLMVGKMISSAVEYEEGSEEELADLRLKLQAATHLLQQNELMINRYEDIVSGAIHSQPLVVDSSTCTSCDFSELRRAGAQATEMSYVMGAAMSPPVAGGPAGMDYSQGANPNLDPRAQAPYEDYVGQRDPYANPPGGRSGENGGGSHTTGVGGGPRDPGETADSSMINSGEAPVPYLLLNSLEAELRKQERRRQNEEELYLIAVDAVTEEAGRLVQLMRAVAANSEANLAEAKSGAYDQH